RRRADDRRNRTPRPRGRSGGPGGWLGAAPRAALGTVAGPRRAPPVLRTGRGTPGTVPVRRTGPVRRAPGTRPRDGTGGTPPARSDLGERPRLGGRSRAVAAPVQAAHRAVARRGDAPRRPRVGAATPQRRPPPVGGAARRRGRGRGVGRGGRRGGRLPDRGGHPGSAGRQ